MLAVAFACQCKQVVKTADMNVTGKQPCTAKCNIFVQNAACNTCLAF